MPSDSTAAAVKDVRKFTIIQLVITAAFLAVVFWMFNGTDADYPPIWLIVLMMIAIGVGAFFSERVWLTGTPLDPTESAQTNQELAITAYANQTVRKLIYCETPLVIAVFACFIGNYGGWPVLIAALPGLTVQAWETLPHLRNTSMSAAILDSKGAESRLVENFVNA